MTEKNKVALIGAGAMGGAIGTRLIETGNQLTVFDLDAEKVAAPTSLGAQTSHIARRVITGQRGEIHAGNGPQQPGGLPLLLDRATSRQRGHTPLHGAPVDARAAHQGQIECSPTGAT